MPVDDAMTTQRVALFASGRQGAQAATFPLSQREYVSASPACVLQWGRRYSCISRSAKARRRRRVGKANRTTRAGWRTVARGVQVILGGDSDRVRCDEAR